jgi:prepilin-type N-terminal cleavage/methylation domain-containing protein
MNKKGFTLVELLVVIAIIGVLSSVVFASLSTSRGKARIGAAQQTMGSVNAALKVCLNEVPAVAINIPNETINGRAAATPAVPIAVCVGGPDYVSLPATWIYCDGVVGGGCTAASVQTSGVSYSISAFGDGKTVTCTAAGCTTT